MRVRSPKYYQGRYIPKNPHKYVGDVTMIFYRSGMEFRCMQHFDNNRDVLAWANEEVVIPYWGPDGKRHRYFVDFWCKTRQADGKIVESLIEVKPKSQTKPPVFKGRKTARFLKEQVTWAVNQAKWKAAQEICKSKGWSWVVLTEEELTF